MKKIYRGLVLCMAALLLVGALTSNVRADNEDYGVKAYEYVRYMNDNLPRRINNSGITADKTQLTAARTWIVETMAEIGYTEPEYFEGVFNSDEYCSVCFRKQGKSDKTVVIGAHYDCVDTNGAEDNASGVGMVLELAERFFDTETELSLEFCFWDGEEFLKSAGSENYLDTIREDDPERYENIFCNINLDSIGAGDKLFVYGGKYGDDGVLYQSWGYNMAMRIAREIGVELHEVPLANNRYIPPTRSDHSDQEFFYKADIPYMYFEANAWMREDGTLGNAEWPFNYNSVLDCFAGTDGRIIHTKFDDTDQLEELVPGRVQEHLTDVSRVVSEIIRQMDESSPEKYAHYMHEDDLDREYRESTAEEESETEETSAEEESSETETPESSAETAEVTETEQTETETAATTETEEPAETTADREAEESRAAEEASRRAAEEAEQEQFENMKLIYIIGCAAVAVILIMLCILFARRR